MTQKDLFFVCFTNSPTVRTDWLSTGRNLGILSKCQHFFLLLTSNSFDHHSFFCIQLHKSMSNLSSAWEYFLSSGFILQTRFFMIIKRLVNFTMMNKKVQTTHLRIPATFLIWKDDILVSWVGIVRSHPSNFYLTFWVLLCISDRLTLKPLLALLWKQCIKWNFFVFKLEQQPFIHEPVFFFKSPHKKGSKFAPE